MPKRINKAIELLESGEPTYYVVSHRTGPLNYENGKKMSKTWADIIQVDMEHEAFDPAGLGRWMEGLIDGGPTASGHRTPAVICSVPINGRTAEEVRYNAWMFKQVLTQGVHGVLLTHCESPGAVKEFVQGCRYAFQMAGVGEGLDQGRRGSAGQARAAELWGISVSEYLQKADVWPLNPDGELLLGLKIETKWGLVNADLSAAVPGIGFAEWGPGDMGMSMGMPEAHDPPYPPELQKAMARVMKACKDNNLFFLNMADEGDITQAIDMGVRVVSADRGGEAMAKKGRAYTKRSMPV